MPPKDRPPSDPNDAAKGPLKAKDLIRRARDQAQAESVSEIDIFARMDEDDRRDEADSIEGDESFDPPLSSFEADSTGVDSEVPVDGGTVHEENASVESTVNLPSEAFQSDPEPPPEPDLSNPAPYSSRTSTLIATPLYRPSRRAPLALLRVYDDDQTGYETVRIRRTPFDMGRQEGDLVIGHESLMSRRHARIDRVRESDGWKWFLFDLRATNGTFLKVDHIHLEDRMDLFLGADLIRFQQHSGSGKAELVKVAPGREEQRVTLPPGKHHLGTDAAVCLPFLRDSPFLDPRHLLIESDKKGHWRISDRGSTNGLWQGITDKVEIRDGACFLAGEQRFSFHLP